MLKALNLLSGENRKAIVGTIAAFITAMVSHLAPNIIEQAPWLEEAVFLLLSYVAVWLTPNRPAST